MTEYNNELRGVLFKNEDKQTDKHPDYRGQATIEGVEYFLDVWINESQKTGKKFLSCSFKKKDKQPGAKIPRKPTQPKSGTGFDDMDDDIPF